MVRKLILLALFAALAADSFAQDRRRGSQNRKRDSYSISGIVVLDDGTPPSEPAEVMLVCSGVVRQRVQTKTDGQFFFDLGAGGSPDIESPETAAGPIGGETRSFNQIGRGFGDDGRWGSGRTTGGRLYLADCELVASLPGFISDVVYPGNLDTMGNPDVGSVRLRRRTPSRGTTISLKSLSAPPKATSAYGKARQEFNKKKPDLRKAVRELEKAVGIYPEFAAAWHYLGRSYQILGDTGKALAAYERAMACDSEYLLPVLGLAELYLQTERHAESSELSGRVIKGNPNVILGWYLHGYANLSLGHIDLAEQCVRKVLASPEVGRYTGTHYLMGSIFALRGDIPAALAEYARFLELTPNYPAADSLRKQMETWSSNLRTEQARSPEK